MNIKSTKGAGDSLGLDEENRDCDNVIQLVFRGCGMNFRPLLLKQILPLIKQGPQKEKERFEKKQKSKQNMAVTSENLAQLLLLAGSLCPIGNQLCQ